MERANKEGADVLATRPNGQTGLPVFTSRLAQRKSFHPRRESKENAITETVANGVSARPASSGSSSDNRTTAAHATKIPRPSPAQRNLSNSRKPLSLSEAYRMAEEEEAARGSPSPAPRSWRHKGDSNENRMQKILSQEPLKLGSRRNSRRSAGSGQDDDTQSSTGSTASRSLRSEISENDTDRKLVQYEEDQRRMSDVIGAKNGIFSKTKVGTKVAETGEELHRKTSDNSLDEDTRARGPRSWGIRGKSNPNWLKRMISSPEKVESTQSSTVWEQAGRDDPLPSVENGAAAAVASPAQLRPATVPPTSRSPNKSFAWQADADFTAGDLQISSSPPVKVGALDNPPPRPRNNKLDEIRQLEIEAALKFPDEPQRPETAHSEDMDSRKAESENSHSQNRLNGRTNTKIDEIRAREIESLSRRALATARLGEIRERNSEYRSPSPDVVRKSSRELLRDLTPGPDEERQGQPHERTILEEEGERIPDTPITIFRKSPIDKALKPVSSPVAEDKKTGSRSPSNLSPRRSHSREDSREVLRRLARVTSTSPSLEDQVARDHKVAGNNDRDLKPGSVKKNTDALDETNVEKSAKPPEIREPEEARAAVGFTALRRVTSTDSASTKRSSVAQSDGDPIDRIEAEMKLFAPLDAQSERGSIRAPSPSTEDDEDEQDVEETPRSKRTDPLSQPTPKVTGAYIETPATVKVDRTGDASMGPRVIKSEAQRPLSSIAVAPFLRGRPSLRVRPGEPKTDNDGRGLGRSTSISVLRRSRSVPRQRSALINSAKPPSVRDDLLEIIRLQQVEDSTLDDFGEMIASHSVKPSDIEKIVKPELTESDEAAIFRALLTQEHELQAYDRMSKSLKTGLLGIQTAKKGIERLEDQVSHSDPTLHHLHDGHIKYAHCPLCDAHQPAATLTYVHVPVPRLFYRQPQFRFTVLGLLFLLLATWFAAESTMCFYYCKPEFCHAGQDCSWSPDDPFFGYAIPVKLDQWTMGGQGRVLVHRLGEQVEDTIADGWDFIAGTDIAQVDTRYFDIRQKRQHRRRLRKKGLIKPWQSPPDQKAKLDAWRSAREARDMARDAREMGYDIGDGLGDERMTADEMVYRK